MAWLKRSELQDMGFAKLGDDVLISDKASLYGCQHMSLGNNVRIDDFCILSAGDGGIELGDFVHIAGFALLVGQGRIVLQDFAGLSSRVSVYSSSDDYSGTAMTNPTVPSEFTNVTHEDVSIGRHVIVGCGSVILPGAVLEDGVAVGALTVVNKKFDAFGIYSGNPAKRIKTRKRDLLQIEADLRASRRQQ